MSMKLRIRRNHEFYTTLCRVTVYVKVNYRQFPLANIIFSEYMRKPLSLEPVVFSELATDTKLNECIGGQTHKRTNRHTDSQKDKIITFVVFIHFCYMIII